MKKHIEWKLYREEPIDPADPLGEIVITGERRTIELKTIFLDTFLEALIEGLNTLKNKSVAKIDLIDEPIKLIFVKENSGISIHYGDLSATIFNIKKFENELSVVVSEFLDILDKASERMRKEKYDFIELREFIKQTRSKTAFRIKYDRK